jgi:hypothetical protein
MKSPGAIVLRSNETIVKRLFTMAGRSRLCLSGDSAEQKRTVANICVNASRSDTRADVSAAVLMSLPCCQSGGLCLIDDIFQQCCKHIQGLMYQLGYMLRIVGLALSHL